MDDRLAAHTGDDERVGLVGRDGAQPVAQAEGQPVDVVFARGAAGVLKRPGADVRGDGGGNPPLLQEPDRQIPVVGSDVGQARALRHEIGQQLQSRGEL